MRGRLGKSRKKVSAVERRWIGGSCHAVINGKMVRTCRASLGIRRRRSNIRVGAARLPPICANGPSRHLAGRTSIDLRASRRKANPAVWQKKRSQKKTTQSPPCGLALVSNERLNCNRSFENDSKTEETGYVAEYALSLR